MFGYSLVNDLLVTIKQRAPALDYILGPYLMDPQAYIPPPGESDCHEAKP
jgi:hypothetical protein